jgi:hypothetical protein
MNPIYRFNNQAQAASQTDLSLSRSFVNAMNAASNARQGDQAHMRGMLQIGAQNRAAKAAERLNAQKLKLDEKKTNAELEGLNLQNRGISMELDELEKFMKQAAKPPNLVDMLSKAMQEGMTGGNRPKTNSQQTGMIVEPAKPTQFNPSKKL